MLVDAMAWLETGAWTKPNKDLIKKRGNLAIEEFAAAEMQRRWKKIRKRGKKLATLDPRRRHKLRIQEKKMRYATEFFAAIFAGKRRKTFDAAMKRFQDCLGDLNNIAVHEKIISVPAGARSRGGRQRNFAAGLVTGREDARLDTVMAHAIDGYDKVVKIKPFW
jgi:triphosphatase